MLEWELAAVSHRFGTYAASARELRKIFNWASLSALYASAALLQVEEFSFLV